MELWLDAGYVRAGLLVELPRRATSCASASARSGRPTTSRSRRCGWRDDLGLAGRALPGQLDPPPAAPGDRGRRLLRRRLRRPLPAADRRGDPHRAVLRPRLRARAAGGARRPAHPRAGAAPATPPSPTATRASSAGCSRVQRAVGPDHAEPRRHRDRARVREPPPDAVGVLPLPGDRAAVVRRRRSPDRSSSASAEPADPLLDGRLGQVGVAERRARRRADVASGTHSRAGTRRPSGGRRACISASPSTAASGTTIACRPAASPSRGRPAGGGRPPPRARRGARGSGGGPGAGGGRSRLIRSAAQARAARASASRRPPAALRSANRSTSGSGSTSQPSRRAGASVLLTVPMYDDPVRGEALQGPERLRGRSGTRRRSRPRSRAPRASGPRPAGPSAASRDSAAPVGDWCAGVTQHRGRMPALQRPPRAHPPRPPAAPPGSSRRPPGSRGAAAARDPRPPPRQPAPSTSASSAIACTAPRRSHGALVGDDPADAPQVPGERAAQLERPARVGVAEGAVGRLAQHRPLGAQPRPPGEARQVGVAGEEVEAAGRAPAAAPARRRR